MYQTWLKTLSNCALFREISLDEMSGILQCINPKIYEYKKNEYLTFEGEKFQGIGIVLSGEVALTKMTAAGNRVMIAILGPGEMFGEMGAFTESLSWPSTVIAQKNCTVMFFPPDRIVGCCEKSCVSHKKLIINMLRIVSEKALLLNRKVEYLAMKNLRGKISTFLLEEYKKTGKNTFLLPLTRNEMADFLNVSRPSLSREMCKMRDEGIIDFHRLSVRIKDLAALKEMAANT